MTNHITSDKVINEKDNPREDRNFDPIADHFADKVYGGLKGDIRLAVLKRDITQAVTTLADTFPLTQTPAQELPNSTAKSRPLRILDIGAGLAQLSIELAKQGHDVTINDISANMIAKAQQSLQDPKYIQAEQEKKAENQDATTQNTQALDNITWLVCPYQQLEDKLHGKYDLILCHALLEWLAEPQAIMDFFAKWLTKNGIVSLCFYNPASFVYRNLVMGNFNLLNNPNYKADNKKSLTPNHPVAYDEVATWLEQTGFKIDTVSGLRVFHDYSPLKRGGHTNPDAVIEMEVRYSGQEPFKWLGRYLHIMARYVG
ncbi:methyltransferase domain-containing protein [Psychrobacter sp. I-STPA10]|uniref:methyltransferase domain-containing protein n=1 Tax=Psychrobacter sp. I-STPA10 TaxID=2585769 RepID=UPI001E648C59|nr:methyltransferase domain-containing protein [Psychrobacter sp. I-STPA10]